MEWFIVLGIVGLFWLYKYVTRNKKPTLGMTSKDIGEIADQMWDEWKGD